MTPDEKNADDAEVEAMNKAKDQVRGGKTVKMSRQVVLPVAITQPPPTIRYSFLGFCTDVLS